MDRDTEKQQLEDEKAQIQGYLDQPLTKHWLDDNKEQQNVVLKIITDHPVRDLEGLFALLEARGHLRGLRRAEAMLVDGLETIKERIKEL